MASYTYAGLSPKAALDLWAKKHYTNGGADASDDDVSFLKLYAENPGAWQLLKTGMDNPADGGKTRLIFNQGTGTWDTQEKKGYWSHPESWIQLAAGAGLGLTAATGGFGLANAATDTAPATDTGLETAGESTWSGAPEATVETGTEAGAGGDAAGLAGGEETTGATTAAGTGTPGAGLPGSAGYAAGDITDASQLAGMGFGGAGAAGAGGVTSWLGKNALGLTGIAGQLVGTAIQSAAMGKATDAQVKLAEQALAYEKARDTYQGATEANRYARMAAGVSPYVSTGGSADAALANALGLPAPPPAASVPPPPTYANPPLPAAAVGDPNVVTQQAPSGSVGGGGLGRQQRPGGAPQTVLMRAPDGSTKQVPATELQHWQSLGAVRVA